MAKEKKYITLNKEGVDFRTMASAMTDIGYKMNHATARNQLILAIKTLVGHISTSLNANLTQSNIKSMIKSQEVHENLSDVLYKAYHELKKDGEI